PLWRLAWTLGAAATLLGSSALRMQARGQQEQQLPRTVRGAESTPKVKPYVLQKSLRDLPKPKAWKEGDPIKEVPRRSYNRHPNVPKTPGKPAPLLGFQNRAAAVPLKAAAPAPVLNIDGQGFTGVNPSDSAGDVGGEFFIQAINGSTGTHYTIYRKTDGSV